MAYALKHYKDLDDSYIRKQKKKIFLFAATITISASSFFVAMAANGMEKREISKVYNNYLSEATLTIASDKNKNDIDGRV